MSKKQHSESNIVSVATGREKDENRLEILIMCRSRLSAESRTEKQPLRRVSAQVCQVKHVCIRSASDGRVKNVNVTHEELQRVRH